VRLSVTFIDKRTAMADETQITSGSLIPAEKVNGTNVYNRQGEKLGHVEDIMLDKISGRVCYAVMSFGGFLGMGEKHWPLPWSALTYDKGKEGFVVDIDKRRLENAPSYDADEFEWTPDYGRSVDRYYNVPTYWI
jgi:sporulation protein YlmC with PRC-barrel domain